MNISREDSIKVEVSNQNTLTFRCIGRGLYVCDFSAVVSEPAAVRSNFDQCNNTMVVSDLKKKFTRRELFQADEAVKLHKSLGMPSYNRLIRLIENNELKNCPVTPQDVRRAVYIYGPDVGTLKGRRSDGGLTMSSHLQVYRVVEYVWTCSFF